MHLEPTAIWRGVKGHGQLAQLTSFPRPPFTCFCCRLGTAATLLVMGMPRHAALLLREVVR
jgi:hypothetical protein